MKKNEDKKRQKHATGKGDTMQRLVKPVRFRRFNANNNVKVKLTEEGKKILAEHWESIMPKTKGIPEWYEKYIDKRGWWTFQFWELASIFGRYLYNGNSRPPFEMTMQVGIES